MKLHFVHSIRGLQNFLAIPIMNPLAGFMITAGGDNTFSRVFSKMSLLTYFKSASSKDRLPNPRGSLSAVVPPRAISQANQEVQQMLVNQSNSKLKKKRGPYKRYI